MKTKVPAKKKVAARQRKTPSKPAKPTKTVEPTSETVLPDNLSEIYSEEERALFEAVAYGFAKMTVQAYEEKHGLR